MGIAAPFFINSVIFQEKNRQKQNMSENIFYEFNKGKKKRDHF